MKTWIAAWFCTGLLVAPAFSSMISVVQIYEPISLHGTDVDGGVTEVGEALGATVLSRPMALTGAFPEDLVRAIRNPHLLPTNSPNYKVQEANLLVLCNVGIEAELGKEALTVRLDIASLAIPTEVDLTTRQILNLAIIALRKTLEEYQHSQSKPIEVNLLIEGAEGKKESLRELSAKFTVEPGAAPN